VIYYYLDPAVLAFVLFIIVVIGIILAVAAHYAFKLRQGEHEQEVTDDDDPVAR